MQGSDGLTAAAYALPFQRDSGLRWQGGSLKRDYFMVLFFSITSDNSLDMQCRRIERVQFQLPRPQRSPALPGHNPAEH